MATERDILEIADAFQRDLLRREREATTRLLTSYGQAWRRIRQDIRSLQRKIERLQAEGEETEWRELLKRRLELLQGEIEDVLKDLFAETADTTSDLQREFVRAAQSHVQELARTQLPETSGIRASFARLPQSAFDELVGVLGDGSPLREVLVDRAGAHAQAFADLLATGISQGWGARRVAREARRSFSVPQFEALRIVRTESMRAYRNSSIRTMQANRDVIKGWVWHAALTARTCAVCIAMHGTFHTVDEPFASHVMCRCSPVPRVVTPGVQERLEPGERWFARQRESTQAAILGPAKLRAYQDGALKLKDVIGFKRDPKWGPVRWEKSLRDIVGREQARTFLARSVAGGGSSQPVQLNPASTKPTDVSRALVMQATGVTRRAVSAAAGVIDRVHTDGQLPQVRIRNSRAKVKYDGMYVHDPLSGKPVKLLVSPYAARPELTAVHELGHFLDLNAGPNLVGPASVFNSDLDDWRDAIGNSTAIQHLLHAVQIPGLMIQMPSGLAIPFNYKYAHYLLNPAEAWARSYAQYIATRSQDPQLLNQLDAIRNSSHNMVYPSQWGDRDFAPIAAEFDRLFRSRGWI